MRPATRFIGRDLSRWSPKDENKKRREGREGQNRNDGASAVITIWTKWRSDHPQLRTQGLSELMEQNAPDHPAAEVYSRKRSHPGSQQTVGIFNYQFHAVDHLIILIGFTFSSDLRDPAEKNLVGVRANLESHRMADAHVSYLTLGRLNPRQQLTHVGHAADFSAFRKILADQARQFGAEHGAGARRDQFKLSQPASQQVATICQRGDEDARRTQFAFQLPGLQPPGHYV